MTAYWLRLMLLFDTKEYLFYLSMPLEQIYFHIIDYWQVIFYMHFPTYRTAPTMAFDGPAVDRRLEWKIAQTANASAMFL